VTGPESRRLDRLAHLIATSPHNLVARGERASVRERHIAESVAIARALESKWAPHQRWVDVGTGGGLPGLVLAMTDPTVDWLLVEAVHKKADAVRGFAAVLGLSTVEVVAERAEILAHTPGYRGGSQGVVARAVAPLRVLVELARGFVAEHGWLAAVKGSAWEAELGAARTAMDRCAWGDPQVERLPSAPRPTWLVTMRAVGDPPAGVPRRPGVPQRRPF
jgi:16S rRNA (guanine527-N7)-methyltransferase